MEVGMLMTVTARHCDIPEELKERAEHVLDRIANHAARPVDGTVVFDMSDHKSATERHQAEIRLHLSHGDILIAAGAADDHRTALDRAEARLRSQLEKGLARLRGPRRSDSAEPV
jgi:ribosomal subunit interface protein